MPLGSNILYLSINPFFSPGRNYRWKSLYSANVGLLNVLVPIKHIPGVAKKKRPVFDALVLRVY